MFPFAEVEVRKCPLPRAANHNAQPMLSSSTVFRGDTRWLIRRDLMEDNRSTIKTKCLRDNFAAKQRQQLTTKKTHNWQGIDYLIFISFEHITSRWPFNMKRITFNEFINIKQKKRERRRIFRCCFVEIGSISSRQQHHRQQRGHLPQLSKTLPPQQRFKPTT